MALIALAGMWAYPVAIGAAIAWVIQLIDLINRIF